MAQQTNVDEDYLSIEALQSHTQTRTHSVGLLCTIEQRDPEIYPWQHATLTTGQYLCTPAVFEPAIPARQCPQTYASDRVATGTGTGLSLVTVI